MQSPRWVADARARDAEHLPEDADVATAALVGLLERR
jgi:hypothetical protein